MSKLFIRNLEQFLSCEELENIIELSLGTTRVDKANTTRGRQLPVCYLAECPLPATLEHVWNLSHR
jgi:hypothetical protein